MDGRFAMDLNELDQDLFIRLSARGGAQDTGLDPALQTCSPGVGFRGELSEFIVVCLDEKETCLWVSALRASPKDSRKAAAAVNRSAERKAQPDGMVPSRPGSDTLWPCSCHHMVMCCGQSEVPGRATLPPNPGRLKQVHPLLFSSIISPKVAFHKWTLIIEPVWLLILLRPHFPARTWGEIFCLRFSQAEMKLALTDCDSTGFYFVACLILPYLGHPKLWNWCAKGQAQIQSFRGFFSPKKLFLRSKK